MAKAKQSAANNPPETPGGEQIPGGYQREVKTEGPVMALAQVLLFAAIAGGALYFYYGHVTEKKRIADLVTEGKKAAKNDDAPALLKAKELFEQTGKVKEDDRALVAMAELTAQLYQAYGMADMKGPAAEYVELAKERELQKAERYAAEAYLLIGDGRPQDAERVITDLTKKGVRHAKLLHALAVAKLAQGKAKEAQVACEEGMKLSTALVRLPITHGDAMLAQGTFASATNSYNKALQLNPDHLRARTAILLVQAVSRQGKPKLLHKEAARLLAEANDIRDGNPPPRVKSFIEYTDGEIYLSEGKAKQALKLAEAALATDNTIHDALSLKGRALAMLKKYKAAQKAFDAALAAVPTSAPYAQAAFDVLYRAGKKKVAVTYLEKVQKANPENGHIYVSLAIAQAKAGKAKLATETAKKAIEKLGNAHPDALFAVARALQANKEWDKAREKYNEAMQEKGTQTWPEVFYEMGWVRYHEKDYAAAQALFKSSIAQWEKARAPIETIADAYTAMGDATRAMGGRANKRAAQKFYDMAKKIRSGS